ncbi:MAG: hypothetical protein HQK60_10010 [Deltaproteobacteria bacterium]|nr:hypothetical protein [Deltaproteobacteria bacterium]
MNLVVHAPMILPDSPSYLDNAKKSPLTIEFYFGSRPPTIPLFYHMLNSNPKAITIFQTLLCMGAWSMLGLTMAGAVKNWLLKALMVGSVAGLALLPDIQLWNTVILSESISYSLFAILCSLMFIMTTCDNRPRYLVAVTGIAGVLFGSAKDTNAYLGLFVGLVMILIFVLSLKKGTKLNIGALLLGFLFASTFLFSNYSADHVDLNPDNNRWEFSFFNIMGKRILVDDNLLAHFKQCGMPVNDALIRRTDKWVYEDSSAFYTDPELKKFRVWVKQSGKSCYANYLIRHPDYAFKRLFIMKDWILHIEPTIDLIGVYASKPYKLDSFAKSITLHKKAWLNGLLLTGSLLMVLIIVSRSFNKYIAFSLIMLMLTIPHAFVCYHGDVMEILRHCLPVALQLYLGLILLSIFCVDTLVPMVKSTTDRLLARSHL